MGGGNSISLTWLRCPALYFASLLLHLPHCRYLPYISALGIVLVAPWLMQGIEVLTFGLLCKADSIQIN